MAVMLPRQTWTDERLDQFEKRVEERFNQVDERLDRVEGDIRELRAIMLGGFATVIAAVIGLSAF